MKESDLPGILIIGKTMGAKQQSEISQMFSTFMEKKICVSSNSARSHAGKLRFPITCDVHHPYLHERVFIFRKLILWRKLAQFLSTISFVFDSLLYLTNHSLLPSLFLLSTQDSLDFRVLILNTQVPKTHCKLIPSMCFCSLQRNITSHILFSAEVDLI